MAIVYMHFLWNFVKGIFQTFLFEKSFFGPCSIESSSKISVTFQFSVSRDVVDEVGAPASISCVSSATEISDGTRLAVSLLTQASNN
jgi:hypothetical protein